MKQALKHSNNIKHKRAFSMHHQWKRISLAIAMLLLINIPTLMAQCALCTKTAQQLGDGPASGLNKGILYLMCIPLGILSIIGYKWYKKEKVNQAQDTDNPTGQR